MSLRYSHTLIPSSPKFIPSATQVQAFLAVMAEHGVIGTDDRKVDLRTPSNRSRTVRNPFTGKTETYPMWDHTVLAGVSAVTESIATLTDYEVGLAGMGRPQTPPMPLDFDEPYHVGTNCRRSSRLCSTSDLHEESGQNLELPYYGEPCIGVPKVGYFSDPRDLRVIHVPDGGCARFWLEFELGNWLFPRFDQHDLRFLNPTIVAEAEHVFETSFVQGCHWG